jgi:hypothetical protein
MWGVRLLQQSVYRWNEQVMQELSCDSALRWVCFLLFYLLKPPTRYNVLASEGIRCYRGVASTFPELLLRICSV